MKKPGKFKKKFTHSYADLVWVGRRHYNDKGFCAVIAAAVLNDWSFGIAKAKLEARGYRHHCGGVYLRDSLALLAEHGKVALPVEREKYGKNLHALSKNVPKNGRYLFHIDGHVAAVRDGVLECWSAGLRRSLKPIRGVYKIEDIAGV